MKDSKLLTPEKREELFEIIMENCTCISIIIPPEEIDWAVLGRDGLNLNWLEAVKSSELINLVQPDKVILDCPSPNMDAYRNYVLRKINCNTEVVAEHKADFNYTIVAAASIIAKVIRDREIEKLKQEHCIECGSGYLTDPVTKKFLEENWDKYPFFRKTWSSWKLKREAKLQKNLGNWE